MRIKTTVILALSIIFTLLSSNVTSAQEATGYIVNWQLNPEPNVVRYIIFRSLYQNTGYDSIATVDSPTNTFIDTTVEKGTKYYYRVIAENNNGDRSAFSNVVSGFTIPQNADETTKAQCQIMEISKNSNGSYVVNWSTQTSTIGFIQYDKDETLDSLSQWDNEYRQNHSTEISNLLFPQTYLLRAVSYDANNNMIISTIDTIVVEPDNPVSPTAPILTIYPVPYRPASGQLYLTGLPLGGTVSIFDSRGIKVWQKDNLNSTYNWDGKNTNGDNVSSGVYYVITKDKENKIIDKRAIMLVR